MERDLRIIRHLFSALIAIIGCYLMSVLSALLVPLALALFLAILLQPALAYFEAKEVRFSVSLGIISAASAVVLAIVGAIIYSTTASLLDAKVELLAQLDDKLSGLSGMLGALTGQHVESGRVVVTLKDLLLDWLQSSMGAMASVLGDFTSLSFMTLLYLLAFIGSILRYESYLHYLRDGGEGGEEKESGQTGALLQAFEEIKHSIVTYMKIKVLVSLLTAASTWLLCTFFGLKFALFWAFLAFGLNFIPTIGSVIAMVPPILLAFVQLSTGGLVTFSILLIIAQNGIGNVIEPRMMGSSLSLNTATVILGLVFWGKIWGLTGMFLSVPLLVLTKVILSQIPDAAVLVRLMGVSQSDDDSPPPEEPKALIPDPNPTAP